MLQQWFGCGNGLYVHFTLASTDGRYGYWCLTKDPRKLRPPKYRALEAAGRHPAAEYGACR